MAKELLKREEVRVEDTWNVADMYATEADWEAALAKAESLTAEIEAMEGKCCASAENLLFVLDKLAEGHQILSLAYNYAQRLFDQDQNNTKHQSMSAKVGALHAKCAAKTAFIDPEILDTPDEVIENYFKELPALELYRK